MIVVLMALMTAGALFVVFELGKANRTAAAEVVLAKGWSQRFAKQALNAKKESCMEAFERYHRISEKKVKKKIKEWDKQIADYQKSEEAYLGGHRFTLMDAVTLFGYQMLVSLKLDGENELLRTLVSSCEHTGYVELAREQETGEKKNSFIYAYFLLASLFSFIYFGILLAMFLAVLTIAAGSESRITLLAVGGGFVVPAIMGYVPYDGLKAQAVKRQEQIDLGFPNAISKITLLTTAGMNITKAIEETANSENNLMCLELRSVIREMGQGSTVQAAFMRLQARCNNRYLDKMVTVITKSYVSGNANLASDLKAINDECWLDRKHNARRMGEKIQSKLLIPTMLMFAGILVVVIVPALSGFSF